MAEFEVTLKHQTTRQYKFEEPCVLCEPKEVMANSLACAEVPGRVAEIASPVMGLAKEGFVCDCVLNATALVTVSYMLCGMLSWAKRSGE